jgi:hypothetical protein
MFLGLSYEQCLYLFMKSSLKFNSCFFHFFLTYWLELKFKSIGGSYDRSLFYLLVICIRISIYSISIYSILDDCNDNSY